MKTEFLSENFQFLVAKFSIYLIWRVFVMNAFISETRYPQKKKNNKKQNKTKKKKKKKKKHTSG